MIKVFSLLLYSFLLHWKQSECSTSMDMLGSTFYSLLDWLLVLYKHQLSVVHLITVQVVLLMERAIIWQVSNNTLLLVILRLLFLTCGLTCSQATSSEHAILWTPSISLEDLRSLIVNVLLAKRSIIIYVLLTSVLSRFLATFGPHVSRECCWGWFPCSKILINHLTSWSWTFLTFDLVIHFLEAHLCLWHLTA